jgi:hypothetical protein
VKKADLKVGKFYADSTGNARLLLHKGIWLCHGNSGDRWVLRESGAGPRKNVGYFHSPQGMLVAVGADRDTIERWYNVNPWVSEVLEEMKPGSKAKYHHRSIIDEIVQSAREHGIVVFVSDHRRWTGTLEDVVRRREEIQARAWEERERMDSLYTERSERASAIKRTLLDKYGIEKTTTRMKLTHGRHGTQRSIPDGVTLALSDLETLLGLNKEEN